MRLFSAGSNAQGQLAHGGQDDAHEYKPCRFSHGPSATSSDLPPGTTSVVKIVGGANHTLLLLETETGQRQLWACGDGSAGQLSLGDSARDPHAFSRLDLSAHLPATSTIKDVAAAWQTSYAVIGSESSDDFVLASGADDFGALAGASAHRISLRPAFPDADGAVLEIAKLVAGPRHVLALVRLTAAGAVTRRAVVGWGACRHGQLGATGKPLTFVATPSLVHVEGSADDPVVDAAAGAQHSLFVHRSGRVSALGADRYGQCAAARAWTGVGAVGCTWNGSYAVAAGGQRVLAAGNNAHGQLGLVGDAAAVIETKSQDASFDLACGSEHVLALSQHPTPRIHVWGWNEHGNLGLGHTNDVRVPVVLDNNLAETEGLKPMDIWAGCGTSWILFGGDA
jgi:protein ATS1